MGTKLAIKGKRSHNNTDTTPGSLIKNAPTEDGALSAAMAKMMSVFPFEKLFKNQEAVATGSSPSSKVGDEDTRSAHSQIINTMMGPLTKFEACASMSDGDYEREMFRALLGLPSEAPAPYNTVFDEFRNRLDQLSDLSAKTFLTNLANGKDDRELLAEQPLVCEDDFEYFEDIFVDPAQQDVARLAHMELQNFFATFASSALSNEDKLALLKRKYMKLMNDDLKARLDSLSLVEQIDTLKDDKELVKKELEKANVIKSRLELLCRDLQSENRRLKEEALKRTDLDARLEQPRASVPAFKLPPRRDLDIDAMVRLFNEREKLYASQLNVADLDLQTLQVKVHRKELELERERHRADLLERQSALLNRNEAELKAQLSIYVDKFKQVEETLGKSNDLFTTFRAEMEQMTQKLTKLERENGMLQTKCTSLSKNIIELVEERGRLSNSLEHTKKQRTKLEQLCRLLQSECRKQPECACPVVDDTTTTTITTATTAN
jgi:archaellum component FlaC